MASELLNKYGNAVSSLELIPSGGGVFEVEIDGKLVFSKKELDRFPEHDEILAMIPSGK